MRVMARRLAQASALLTAGWPIAASASEQGDDAAALAQRLQTLRDRVEAIESGARPAVSRSAPAQAVTGGAFPGSWKLPGSDTSIRFAGYVRTDVMMTTGASADRSIGDSLVLSSIPVDNSAGARQGGDVRLHARNSRLRLESRTPTEWGSFNTQIEGDFFGAGGNQRFSNSNGFRLLQAYGALGPVLAGQSHSTFMDQDTAPETVEKFGPAGDSNLRQAQIRYTHAFMPGLEADAAIENPSANAGTPVGAANANNVDKLPDFVARVRYRESWGAVNVAGVARYFNYDDGATGSDSAWGGGVHVGATVHTWGQDSLKFNFNFGPGLGRYVRTTNTSPELNVTCAAGRSGRFEGGVGDTADAGVVGGAAVRSSCGGQRVAEHRARLVDSVPALVERDASEQPASCLYVRERRCGRARCGCQRHDSRASKRGPQPLLVSDRARELGPRDDVRLARTGACGHRHEPPRPGRPPSRQCAARFLNRSIAAFGPRQVEIFPPRSTIWSRFAGRFRGCSQARNLLHFPSLNTPVGGPSGLPFYLVNSRT